MVPFTYLILHLPYIADCSPLQSFQDFEADACSGETVRLTASSGEFGSSDEMEYGDKCKWMIQVGTDKVGQPFTIPFNKGNANSKSVFTTSFPLFVFS